MQDEAIIDWEIVVKRMSTSLPLWSNITKTKEGNWKFQILEKLTGVKITTTTYLLTLFSETSLTLDELLHCLLMTAYPKWP